MFWTGFFFFICCLLPSGNRKSLFLSFGLCLERERDAYLKVDCFILFGDGFVGSRIGMEKNGEEE